VVILAPQPRHGQAVTSNAVTILAALMTTVLVSPLELTLKQMSAAHIPLPNAYTGNLAPTDLMLGIADANKHGK
jgi:hypothetical protein